MKFLVINGHKYYWYSEGKLNRTIFDEIVNILSKNHEVKTTIVENGYNVDDEIDKFKWADIIIFQTPVNWYSLPWIFKKYIDEVYQMGSFFQSSEEYGQGGLMKCKKYMLSLTWSTPKEVFGKKDGFFDNKSVDDIFLPFHGLQKFCAMEPLETFSVYDVVKNPKIEQFLEELRAHLELISA